MVEPQAITLVKYYMERSSEHPALHQPTLELIHSRLRALHAGDHLHEVHPPVSPEPLPPLPTRRQVVREAYTHEGEWRVPLNDKGAYAVVDAEDVDFLQQWTWYPSNGYAYVKLGRKPYAMHRVIASRFMDIQGLLVDHKDLDGLNNRRSNLRAASKAQNAQNKRATRKSKSGVKGVSPEGSKWRAQIRGVGGTTHYLGRYDTIEEAAAVYAEASTRLHGEFGRV
jgi:hypothetical protein